MLGPIQNAELFLINTLFDLYLMILTVRFILCLVRADYFNPITRFVVRCTQPIIGPLRRILPTVSNVEISSLVFIILFDALKFFLIGLVIIGMPKNVGGLFVLAGADTLKLFLNTFFYGIFLWAILSWFQGGFSPITQLLTQLTSPVMRPVQRIVPPIGAFDLSPIVALIFLQLLIILLVNPLLSMGMESAFG